MPPRTVTWLLSLGALLLVASVCRATPPAVIDVWIDADRIHRAALVFGDAEREWFKSELTRVSGADQYRMFPPPAPLVGLRNPQELDAALIRLICPSLQRRDVGTIQRFLATVNKGKMIRGRGTHAGWTVVSYHLLQESGQPWRLEARHENVSGPSEQANPLREQTGPAFSTYVDCAAGHPDSPK